VPTGTDRRGKRGLVLTLAHRGGLVCCVFLGRGLGPGQIAAGRRRTGRLLSGRLSHPASGASHGFLRWHALDCWTAAGRQHAGAPPVSRHRSLFGEEHVGSLRPFRYRNRSPG